MTELEKIFEKDFLIDIVNSSKDWIIHELPGLVIMLFLFVAIYKALGFFMKKLEKILTKRTHKHQQESPEESIKRIDTLINIIEGGLKIVLWTILLMTLLKKVGVEIGPILASAGIIGLAVGFGAQELVRDFISGFFIILENQIRTNDVAILNGTAGLVEKIELRTIKLRDYSGVVHVFQNGKINSLSNMTKDWSAILLSIGVAYKENIKDVMKIMEQVGDELKDDSNFEKRILQPIEVLGLDKFDDSAIIVKVRIITKPIEQWEIARAYRLKIKEAFDQNNIEIPFPHRTVYWGNEIKPLQLDILRKTHSSEQESTSKSA